MASDMLAVLSFLVFALMKILPCLSSFPTPLLWQKPLWMRVIHSGFSSNVQPVMRVRISLVKVITMPPARVRNPLER